MVERYRIFAFTTFYRADSMPRPYNIPIGVAGAAHAQPSVNDPCTGVSGRGVRRPYASAISFMLSLMRPRWSISVTRTSTS